MKTMGFCVSPSACSRQLTRPPGGEQRDPQRADDRPGEQIGDVGDRLHQRARSAVAQLVHGKRQQKAPDELQHERTRADDHGVDECLRIDGAGEDAPVVLESDEGRVAQQLDLAEAVEHAKQHGVVGKDQEIGSHGEQQQVNRTVLTELRPIAAPLGCTASGLHSAGCHQTNPPD